MTFDEEATIGFIVKATCALGAASGEYRPIADCCQLLYNVMKEFGESYVVSDGARALELFAGKTTGDLSRTARDMAADLRATPYVAEVGDDED